MLTGNSANRIEQLYLTNPNSKYAVTLDVMVAVIDDNYTFFSDTINQTGTSIILVEQNARKALAIADRGYVMHLGKDEFMGKGADLLNDPEVAELYLGMGNFGKTA